MLPESSTISDRVVVHYDAAKHQDLKLFKNVFKKIFACASGLFLSSDAFRGPRLRQQLSRSALLKRYKFPFSVTVSASRRDWHSTP